MTSALLAENGIMGGIVVAEIELFLLEQSGATKKSKRMSVTRVEKNEFWGLCSSHTVEKSSTPDLHRDRLRPETKQQHKETLEKTNVLRRKSRQRLKGSFADKN